jgi:putative inorganic carbon (HCO3(-)) transporter
MLADFPFTGVGMGLFNQVASLLYAFQSPRDPGAHNVYLQVGVDLGILGLIAYVAVLILALWMALTAMRAFERKGNGELRAMAVGALSGMIALMVHGLVDVAAWGTRAAFFPWLLIGLIAALFTTATREEE